MYKEIKRDINTITTRQEKTFKRDLNFSQWVRNNLPNSSTGYSASDLDFILWNWKTKKVILIETKTNNDLPTKGQFMMFKNLEKWIENGIESGWRFYGFHVIKFEKTNFENGKVYFDEKEITEEQLKQTLSLEY